MNQKDLKKSDDQFLAVTEAMGLAADAMESNGTDTLLVINLADTGDNAILGGVVNDATIERCEQLLADLKQRQEADLTGVLHVWTTE